MTTQTQIDKLEKELKAISQKGTKLMEQIANLKSSLEQEQDKTEWVKIKLESGKIIEIERYLHTEMDRIKQIKIPENCELLSLGELLEIYSNHKDKFDFGGLPDEIVKQPIKENEKDYPYWNIWFRRVDNGSELDGCGRGLQDGSRVRGVRFCKKLGRKKNDIK